MFTSIMKQTKTAFLLLLVFSLLTGVMYPAFVTMVAQVLFPWQANGSLIKNGDKVIGSMLIGQQFSDPKYFWGRPSATKPFPYNATSSAGSNLGPTNPELLATIKSRAEEIHKANPEMRIPIPIELVTSSASGLDPEIGVRAASYQTPRIANARHISKEQVSDLIKQFTKGSRWGIFGMERVNVLELNLALDQMEQQKVTR